jgi:serine/threonine-protein kinase
VGSQTAEVRGAAEYLNLRIVFTDANGNVSPSLEGVVVGQTPTANREVASGSSVRLKVATKTVVVPTFVGMTLDDAASAAFDVALKLVTESKAIADARPGTIIAQVPEAGTNAAAGSQVTITVAAASRGVTVPPPFP